MKFTSQELASKYDRFAPWYDWVEGVPDLLGVAKLRRRLLQRASGKVLEVAVGTGKNLEHYPAVRSIIAVDLSRQMLGAARRRSGGRSQAALFLRMDGETLAFKDGSFDTVVSSLSTCTFPDPIRALREMVRVCRSEGRILLLEHGRSDRERLGRWQDRRAERHAKQLGCHWNREPIEIARQAGLTVVTARRFFFGIFQVVEAKP